MSQSMNLKGDQRINLTRLSALAIDDNIQALDLLGQILMGFGVRNLTKCVSAEEAKAVMARMTIDLVVADAQMPGISGYEFTQWLRTSAGEPNRFAPLLLMTGETRASHVFRGRDAGANFVIAKPVTPKVLLDRIFWLARDRRQFIDADGYAGPDRRFKRLGPPPDVKGRREGDLSPELGVAVAPNLTQDQINAMMKPARVSI